MALDWTRLKTSAPWRRARIAVRVTARGASRRLGGRQALAAVPALVGALGLAMAASSAPRPEIELTAEAVARVTRGDLGPAGAAALLASMDPAQRAIALRHDPRLRELVMSGRLPQWQSLLIADPTDLAVGVEAQKLNAAAAVAPAALRPALPFWIQTATTEDRARAVRCLTQAVYYEAALESDDGQAAVAQVVLNRVRDPNYPSSVCGVVFEGAERNTGCQFSFTCDGALSQAPVSWAWERARKVAERALDGHVALSVGTATHYHADYVRPWWAPTLARITQIGTHIFYRWKGAYGETAAFRQRYAGREPVIDEARFSRPRLMVAGDPQAEPATAEAAPALPAGFKTVEIDGRSRVVGVVNLGGRRAATAEDIAAINARLKAYEEAAPTPPVPAIRPAPAGVVQMDVEEVGRPVRAPVPGA
ncbi:cell wall hydrolase [Brevundimonas sp. VNH65]|uniref:cell wall hydrolase n=1 Tax=Brevundimonas sp. VNH65 TaxID=3400917 RepID=UPI003BFE400E